MDLVVELAEKEGMACLNCWFAVEMESGATKPEVTLVVAKKTARDVMVGIMMLYCLSVRDYGALDG